MKFKLFILIISLLLITGCLGTKQVTEKARTKSLIERTSQKKDSLSAIEKNKAIADKLDIAVPKSNTNDAVFNKRVNEKVDEILAKLNTTKTSGDNSYKLYYNLLKRQIEFEAKIGETQNSTTATNSEDTREQSVEGKIETYIYKKVVTAPWYFWLLFYFIFLDARLTRLLSNVFPWLKGSSTILAIFKRR